MSGVRFVGFVSWGFPFLPYLPLNLLTSNEREHKDSLNCMCAGKANEKLFVYGRETQYGVTEKKSTAT